MTLAAVVSSLLLLLPVSPASKGAAPNPAIDMDGYLAVSARAAEHRRPRLLSESDFLRASREPGTIVLDARSRQRFDEVHFQGALHLDFSDIAIESLARLIPDRSTRILIYCNNNFTNAEVSFPSKLPSASLNLATHVALYNYGYRNVYELGPQIDFRQSILPFTGTAVESM